MCSRGLLVGYGVTSYLCTHLYNKSLDVALKKNASVKLQFFTVLLGPGITEEEMCCVFHIRMQVKAKEGVRERDWNSKADVTVARVGTG